MRTIFRLAVMLAFAASIVLPLAAQITIKIPTLPKIGGQAPKGNPQNAADLREALYSDMRSANIRVDHVATLMEYYDPNLTGNGISLLNPSSNAEWKEVMDRLASLDELCKTRYQNVTNDPNFPANWINGKPIVWCAIAANRVEYEKKARGAAVDERAESFVRIWRYEIEKTVSDQKGFVSDDVQRMLFDPKWKSEKFAEIKAVYLREGLGEPSMTMFDAIKPDLDKVRVIIDRDSKAKIWEQPPHTDAAVENHFKSKFVVHPYYTGSTVLKIGGNYTNWRVFKNSLGIPTNEYKRGLFLAKRPGQDGLCQIREWIVKKEYVGGGRFGPMKIESNGGGGIYAKCQ